MTRLPVRLVPCLSDNYGFLVHDPQTGETASVDAPDPDAILAAAKDEGWTLTQLWNTHHHHDHVGGNLALKQSGDVTITGAAHDAERIPGLDRGVREGDTVMLGTVAFNVIEVPGHTRAHIAYHSEEARVVFVGDTLFSLGCGRLFEGDPVTMWDSLKKLIALPDDTRVYCAHEYTQANARFALTIEPENQALTEQAEAIGWARERGAPTIPTSIGAEKAANPFLRPHSRFIRQRLGLQDASDAEVFGAVRARKDVFA